MVFTSGISQANSDKSVVYVTVQNMVMPTQRNLVSGIYGLERDELGPVAFGVTVAGERFGKLIIPKALREQRFDLLPQTSTVEIPLDKADPTGVLRMTIWVSYDYGKTLKKEDPWQEFNCEIDLRNLDQPKAFTVSDSTGLKVDFLVGFVH